MASESSKKPSDRMKDYILPDGHEWKMKEETSSLYYAKYVLVFSAFVIIMNAFLILLSPESSSMVYPLIIIICGVAQIYVASLINAFDPKLRWFLLLSTIPVIIVGLVQSRFFDLWVLIPYGFLYYLVFLDKRISRYYKTKNYMIAVPKK
jgi:hypothetical protein